jgi:hypothetical protein
LVANSGAAASSTFRLPLSVRLLSLVGTGFIGAASLLMFGFLVAVLLVDQWALAVVAAICAAVMVALTRYVARDLQGKWGLRVVLGAESVELFLPRNRSLIHATERQHLTVPYSDIAAIETRLEAYPTFGMVNMQQPYVLRRKNGDTVFLFEERAVGTGLQRPYFGALVREVTQRAGVGVRDLGMVEGRGGVLGVAHTEAADWSAPALAASRQARLMRKAANTGALALMMVMLGFMVRWGLAYLR